MTQPSAILRAQLSRRIRSSAPAEWREFGTLWMAFNAIYGGQPDLRERARVMSAVRRYVDDRAARQVLQVCRPAIDRILSVPPGNMLLDRYNPNFRAASTRCAAIYRSPMESVRSRLAAVAGVLYQVRCNLIHGSKDPQAERDQMLVRESLVVLRELVPAIESGAEMSVATPAV